MIVSGDNKVTQNKVEYSKAQKERRKRTKVIGGERRERQRDLKNSKELVNCTLKHRGKEGSGEWM